MIRNGDELTLALAGMDNTQALIAADPQISLPATANLAADLIYWNGFREIVALPQWKDITHRVPVPQTGEGIGAYLNRVWPLLSLEERGTVIDLGLSQMVSMQHLAEVGIQLCIWRAHQSGDWRGSPACPDTFREWVKCVVTDTLDGSASEASQLATLCEVVGWLIANELEGVQLPEDVESIFRRPLYRRWRSVAGKLRDRIVALQGGEEETVREVAELVDAASDLEMTTDELDTVGRTKPRLPSIPVIEEKHDYDTGFRTLKLQVSEAQLAMLYRRLNGVLDYKLLGEQSDKKVNPVQYRVRLAEEANGFTGEIEGVEKWDFRNWKDGSWGPWEHIPKPSINGDHYLESVMQDPDLQVTYYQYLKTEPVVERN